MLKLIFLSFKNRLFSLSLAICSIAVSVTLLLGVEKTSASIRMGFQNAVSGTDLIMGPSGSATNLLLYSVFHMGDPMRNISWESYENIKQDDKVKWTIPISLGDSHRGFRVIGTDDNFFTYFQYGQKQNIRLQKGEAFNDLYEVVLGSQIAVELGYELGSKIYLSHGTSGSRLNHKEKSFQVVGILEPTGTMIDKSLYVSLEAITAIHLGWETGIPLTTEAFTDERVQAMDLTPHSVSAVFIGTNRKADIFNLQRQVNNDKTEALMAVMPQLTLLSLWKNLDHMEKALTFIAFMVLMAALFGLTAILLATLNERRREMAILRSLGARPYHILALLMGEAIMVTLLAIGLGLILLYGALFLFTPYISYKYGLVLTMGGLSAYELKWLLIIFVSAILVSLIPAVKVFYFTLHDGMSHKY